MNYLPHWAYATLLVVGLVLSACAPARATPPGPAAAPPQAAPAEAPAKAAPVDQSTSKPAAATDEAVAGFYRGKTIRIVVGFSAGGGFDQYARVLARKLGEYIPGKPTIIVENMTGAGSLRAANYLGRVAPRDGTQMGTFIESLVAGARLGQQGIEFDPLALNWIGNPQPERSLCAFRTSLGATSFRQLMESGRTLQVGSTGVGGNDWYTPKILEGSGLGKWNVITGFPGFNNIKLAVEQGELDGNCTTGWLRTGTELLQGETPVAKVLLQSGKTRLPELPDVPTWRELDLKPNVMPAVELAEAVETIARPFAMPPGVPPERVAAVREAWLQAWNDPDVLEIAQRGNLALNVQDYRNVEAGVRTVMSVSDADVPRLKEIFVGD